jgi:hypothetical protein
VDAGGGGDGGAGLLFGVCWMMADQTALSLVIGLMADQIAVGLVIGEW